MQYRTRCALVRLDGQLATATSVARVTIVLACLSPPGDPMQTIDLNLAVPAAGTVKCMPVGSNRLQKDVTTEFGPDRQPYFGGQRTMNTFESVPP